MARIARRDTYGIETVGGVEIRRRVIAGQRVPVHWNVPSADLDDPDAPRAKRRAEPPAETPQETRSAHEQLEADQLPAETAPGASAPQSTSDAPPRSAPSRSRRKRSG